MSGLPAWLRSGRVQLGLGIVTLVALVALLAPWLAPHDPNEQNLISTFLPPAWAKDGEAVFPLGTDSLGRCVLSRLIYGARIAMTVALVASFGAMLIGAVLAHVAGYFGGWVDEVSMRAAELFQTIPNLIFVLTIVVILGSTLTNIVIAIGIVSWTSIARMTRAEFLALRDREFVQACRAMGMGNLRIILGEILPNALPPVIVLSSLVVAGAILFESAVSFLGLGDPNVASWGRLVGDGRQLIRSSWYICAIPGVAIMVTVLCLNLIGDGLNDALNPKLRDR